ncbi:MAG: hypothetical protein EZS28_001258 [Streblomastix strix]|uniref:C2 domain-containing protein n=1 Tax=Streblomastix strix TaxID=222440 RepID=A0A5J4X9L5_9EUKA|nr:MAG: hypothetical protein EZS28_001258 [Streblomastix strix]
MKKYDKEEDEEYESDEDDYDYEDEVFVGRVAIPFGRYFLNPQKYHLNLIDDQDEGQNEAAGDIEPSKHSVKLRDQRFHLLKPSLQMSKNVREENKKLTEHIKMNETYFVPGYVYIYLEEFIDLIPFDVSGKSVPYVVFSLGGQEFRTEVAHKTLHPVYNRQYKFDFDPKKTKDREVKFEVWDQNRILWDEPVGELFVSKTQKNNCVIKEEDGADEFLHLGDVLFGILYTTSEEDVDLPALLDKKKQQEKEIKKKQKQKKKQDKIKPDEDEGQELNLDLDSVDSYLDKDHPYDQFDDKD